MSEALITELIEAGTPPALVGKVAMALARASAAAEVLEQRRAKDRDRKRSVPRNSEDSTESAETVEIQPQGSPKVSPPSPLPNPSNIAPLKSPRKKPLQVPDWMPEEWGAFREMRKAMRGVPFTETAERGIIADLEKLKAEGHDIRKVLMKAVKRGYRGVFGDDDTKADVPKVAASASQLRERAEFFDKIGKRDDAAEYRRKAAQAEQRIGAHP